MKVFFCGTSVLSLNNSLFTSEPNCGLAQRLILASAYQRRNFPNAGGLIRARQNISINTVYLILEYFICTHFLNVKFAFY